MGKFDKRLHYATTFFPCYLCLFNQKSKTKYSGFSPLVEIELFAYDIG
ncbi:hypothetical protein VCHENC02_5232A, partial [Vibrio harveyi]